MYLYTYSVLYVGVSWQSFEQPKNEYFLKTNSSMFRTVCIIIVGFFYFPTVGDVIIRQIIILVTCEGEKTNTR